MGLIWHTFETVSQHHCNTMAVVCSLSQLSTTHADRISQANCVASWLLAMTVMVLLQQIKTLLVTLGPMISYLLACTMSNCQENA